MDKPALRHTDFGKVKKPIALGGFCGGMGVGKTPWGGASPRRGDREGTGPDSLGWAFVLSSNVYTIWAIRGAPGQEPPHVPFPLLSSCLFFTS